MLTAKAFVEGRKYQEVYVEASGRPTGIWSTIAISAS